MFCSLWDSAYQWHGVDGTDDHGRQPEGDDGAAAVQEDGGFVLNGVPLHVKGTEVRIRHAHCLMENRLSNCRR